MQNFFNYFRMAWAFVWLLFEKKPGAFRHLPTGMKKLYSYSDPINWKNGWYVNNGGNDNRKYCLYSQATFMHDHGEFKILHIDHEFFQTAGLMKYSGKQKQFRSLAISIVVTPNRVLNAKFALWLKNFYHDVFEVDAVEFQNRRFAFGRRMAKALFTIHKGTNYHDDHHISARWMWLITGKPYRFTLIRRHGWYLWYVNNHLVRKIRDPWPEKFLGIILNYEHDRGYPIDTEVARLKYNELGVWADDGYLGW